MTGSLVLQALRLIAGTMSAFRSPSSLTHLSPKLTRPETRAVVRKMSAT